MVKEITAGVLGALVTALIFWGFGAFRDAGSALTVPENMVAAFKSDKCPTGWSNFTEGRGRYIVGIQPGGKLAQTIGKELENEENRATGKHMHDHTNSYVGGSIGSKTIDGGNSYPRQTPTVQTTATVAESGTTISDGTNAPYVQLLLCQRSG